MSSFGLNTGLRALLSAQFMMDTVGHNIANANVDGYSRQRVDLGAAMPLDRNGILIGSGVDARGVQRSVDHILGRRIFNQTSRSGGLEAQLFNLYEIESMFNEPGGISLGSRFDGFFSSMSELSNSPSDTILRTGVVQSAVELTSQLNQLSTGFGRMGESLSEEVALRVNEVNQLAEEVARLNIEIAQTQGSGLVPNDLMDQQDRAISKLANLADVRVMRNGNSTVRILISGSTLVGNDRAQKLTARKTSGSTVELGIQGSSRPLQINGGAIGGLMQLAGEMTPQLGSDLDKLARNLILEFNRKHAVGIPAGGSFSSLTSVNRVEDQDGDGRVLDELLANAGLPFDIAGGTLHLNVQDRDSAALSRYSIEIDPERTTVGEFVSQLNEIDHITAKIDGFGRLQVTAESGYGFDFSTRLETLPDTIGGLGGGAASLGAGVNAPFGLVDGDTFDLVMDPNGTAVPLSITLDAADFENISQASPEELAAAINSDPNVLANGMVARVKDGQFFLQSIDTGRDAEFQVAGGTGLAAMGWTGLTGSTVSGSDDSVAIELSGAFTGEANEQLTFRPNMDGVIGTTPGLAIEVFDSSGQLLSTLDVGAGYQPGSKLDVGNGLQITFGLGDVSATEFDSFSTEVLTTSDDTDVLASFGMNAFFTGSDAASIAVREDIENDPSLFAGSGSGAASDATQLLSLLSLKDSRAAGLDSRTFGGFYGDLVSDVGSTVNVTRGSLETSDSLMTGLLQRRDQISGVNIDEELVDMLQFEQAFSAASRFINTINQMNDEILSLI